jgi:hypothetical protein
MKVAACLVAVIGLALAGACGSSSRVNPGSLTIRIISPSTQDHLVTNSANVSFGGDVGGWSILDPTPVIHWSNQATGASGQIGQLLGTWDVYGGIDLKPGDNVLTVRAANGVQADAVDVITVTYQP